MKLSQCVYYAHLLDKFEMVDNKFNMAAAQRLLSFVSAISVDICSETDKP